MIFRIAASLAIGLVLIGSLITRIPAPAAADATLTTDAVSVVANGLTSPRGFTWDSEGNLYLVQAGSGGTTPGVPEMPPPLGPFMGGLTASVVRIDNGCATTLANELPSVLDGEGVVLSGATDVAFLKGQLYVLIAGGTEGNGNPAFTNGVYAVNDDGSTTLVADYTAWLMENPPVFASPDGPNPGNLYGMVSDGEKLWITDSVNGLVSTVTPDGTISLAADVSDGHPVPTGIAPAPQGGVYVGMLTAIPYLDGAARVVHIAENGAVTDAWTGLTAITGIAVSSDGTLYAAEMSTGNLNEPPFVVPGSGKIVRQTGIDTAEEVLTDIDLPVMIGFGPEDDLYLTTPAFGPDAGRGLGRVLRIAVAESPASLAGLAPGAPTCGATPVASPATQG